MSCMPLEGNMYLLLYKEDPCKTRVHIHVQAPLLSSPEPLAKGWTFHAQINISTLPVQHASRKAVDSWSKPWNYSSCHHKIIWEPTDLWHSIPHSLLSYAGLLWRQSSFLVLWENSKCKSNPSCPEHRALLSAKLLLMCWATTGLCGDGFMGGQMPKETFISVGWKEQQKFPKSREDQTGAKVLIHCFSFLFCLHF